MLKDIIGQLLEDRRNEAYTSKGIGPIFQVHENARILIIGQAPGKKTEEAGIPFSDKSGDTLRDWMGVTKEEFYAPEIAILPMDFYYPGKGKSGDLPPRSFIAAEYHKKMLSLMPHISLTVLMGSYATKQYLGKTMKKNLTETVKAYDEYLPRYFPIVHSSPLNFRWQGKNPWFKENVVPAFRSRVQGILKEKL